MSVKVNTKTPKYITTRAVSFLLSNEPDMIEKLLVALDLDYSHSIVKKCYRIRCCPVCKKHACLISYRATQDCPVYWFCFRHKDQEGDKTKKECHKDYHFSIFGIIQATKKTDFSSALLFIDETLETDFLKVYLELEKDYKDIPF